MSGINRPAKSFSLTFNNPTPEWQSWMDEGWARTDNPLKFLKAVHEVGESGTPHFQSCCRTKKTCRPTQVARWLRDHVHNAHVESIVGTWDQLMTYVEKTVSADNPALTWGQTPTRKKDTNPMQSIKAIIDAGGNPRELWEEHFPQMVRCYKGVNQYLNLTAPRDDREIEVIWLFGETGTGKSHSCPRGPEVYWKPPGNMWFDGYIGEEVVVLDEFRKNWWLFSYMLRLLDVHPFQVAVKGGYIPFRAKKIYITAPVHPREMYPTREDVGQLIRRCTKIVRCYRNGAGEYVQQVVGDEEPLEMSLFFPSNEL